MTRVVRVALIALIVISLGIALRLNHGALVQDRDHIAEGGTPQYPAGTDALGRDRLTRVAEALLLCLSLAAAAASLATGAAAGIALAAAYATPFFAGLILLLSDALLAVPGLFLLMLLRASLPLGLSPVTTAILTFLLLASLGWPIMVRTLYVEIDAHRKSEWAAYCMALGLRRRQIFLSHMRAHLQPLLRTHFLLCLPAFLAAEANLGTLGLGVPEPLPSWGGMLSELAASSLAGGSNWRYLPAVLLVLVLVMLELLTANQTRINFSPAFSSAIDGND
jgi:ABC-type dipeptide/oligopeptide/nickel transport system permease subunit